MQNLHWQEEVCWVGSRIDASGLSINSTSEPRVEDVEGNAQGNLTDQLLGEP